MELDEYHRRAWRVCGEWGISKAEATPFSLLMWALHGPTDDAIKGLGEVLECYQQALKVRGVL